MLEVAREEKNTHTHTNPGEPSLTEVKEQEGFQRRTWSNVLNVIESSSNRTGNWPSDFLTWRCSGCW